jgi:hypothetical protein
VGGGAETARFALSGPQAMKGRQAARAASARPGRRCAGQ